MQSKWGSADGSEYEVPITKLDSTDKLMNTEEGGKNMLRRADYSSK